MSTSSPLIPSVRSRSWNPDSLPPGWQAIERYQSGSPAAPFEVVVASAPQRPTAALLRGAWRARHGGRPTDVLLVVRYPSGDGQAVAVVGVASDDWRTDVGLDSITRCAAGALSATTPTAVRAAVEPLFAEGTDSPTGLRNEGLFATYALERFRTWHPETWSQAAAQAQGIREKSGPDLLTHLGWQVEVHGDAHLLREAGHSRAVAVLLQGDEVFDRPSLRFGLGTSPVEHALAVAAANEVTWVQAVQGSRVRLYSARPEVGIRRTGITSFTEIDVAHLADDDLAFAGLLLSPNALRPQGTAFDVLEASRTRAADLGARLRDRVYDDVVPPLAKIVARHATQEGILPTDADLADAYHLTLVILFRTLFVAYAEDRALLPFTGAEATGYNRVALNNRAREWAGGQPSFDTSATDLWDDLTQIWRAIFHGSSDWGVPQYGGGLFDDSSPTGSAIANFQLTNAEIGPVLQALLIDKGPDGEIGPVDFESLSVREFGTIYEGLLESSLSIAPTDLALDRENVYVPARSDKDVRVRSGEVYFHNSSGARKATGSYFTKEFAVEHLLTTALDPTLDEHLDRVATALDAGKTADAASLFFDFRVADIAMGSGHFLVGAVDHIAARMSRFLTKHPIAGVEEELNELRSAAVNALGAVGREVDEVALSQESLIRRQVARRCIYGVDINEIAVDLARLALWIHTFVPGLPMSNLDHGLVWGNSLTGIATTDELLELLEPDSAQGMGIQSLFRDEIVEGQERASAGMRRAALVSEATIAEAHEAERLRQESEADLAPVRAIYDTAFAGRLRPALPDAGLPDLRVTAASGWDALVAAADLTAVTDMVATLQPVHFPVTFPEVFGRDRPGFDVVLGNPPWEKVKVEEHGWWGLRFPGLRSMTQKDKNAAITRYRSERPDLVAEYEEEVRYVEGLRAVIRSGPYALGNGDTDLYKVFCWRDWVLVRDGGRAGVVFPRGALSGSGTAAWREEILAHGAFDDAVFLTNTREWVFEKVHPQYTVALTTIRKGGAKTVSFNGPFHSLSEFTAGVEQRLTVEADDFGSWSGGATFPLLPSAASAELFKKLRTHTRFDDQNAIPIMRPIAELHTSANKALYDFDLIATNATIPVFTGASFHLWDPNFGSPYAYASTSEVVGLLQKRRLRQISDSRSAFKGLDIEWAKEETTLPLRRPRIAFRDVARATDSRTVLCCLVPPGVALVEKAPYLFRSRGTARDEAYVLGVLSSIPLDWYARRYVELKLNYSILNGLPVPRSKDLSPSERVAEIAGRLAAIDDRFADWAAEVGVPVGSVTSEAMKDDLIAELDAVVSHLYGLDRDDVIHIFETFHRGWDYRPRLDAVLEHFDRWSTQS